MVVKIVEQLPVNDKVTLDGRDQEGQVELG